MIYKLKLFLSTISILLSIFLVIESVAFAYGSGYTPRYMSSPGVSEFKALPNAPINIRLPLANVSLKEAHQGTNGKLLIHIQDAHSNYSGQINLSKTIEHFIKEYGVNFILSEGSSTDVTLDKLKSLGSKKDWEITARTLLQEGIIVGEEYLNLTKDFNLKILGVEDHDLYFEGLHIYSRLTHKRKASLEYLHKIEVVLDALKNKFYPKELIKYESGEDSFKHQLDKLIAFRKTHTYSSILEYQTLKNLESSIDYTSLNNERKALLGHLPSKAKEKLIRAYQTKNPLAQYSWIRELFILSKKENIRTAEYYQLNAYKHYLELLIKLDMELLAKDMQRLEDDVYNEYLPDLNQKKLRVLDRYLSLLDKAYRTQMNSDEFKSLVLNRKDFPTKGFQAFLNQKLMDLSHFEELIPYKNSLEVIAEDIHNFYSIVRRRDSAFVVNTSKILSNQDKEAAILIAGGYHTANLTHLLKQEGYSYIVLSPYIEHATDHENYEKLLFMSLNKQSKPTQIAMRDSADPNIDTYKQPHLATPTGGSRLSGSKLDLRIPAEKIVQALDLHHQDFVYLYDEGLEDGSRLSGDDEKIEESLDERKERIKEMATKQKPPGGGKWNRPSLLQELNNAAGKLPELTEDQLRNALISLKLINDTRFFEPAKRGRRKGYVFPENQAEMDLIRELIKQDPPDEVAWTTFSIGEALGMEIDVVWRRLQAMKLTPGERKRVDVSVKPPQLKAGSDSLRDIEARDELVKQALKENPPDGKAWTRPELADHVGITQHDLRTSLKRIGELDSKRLRKAKKGRPKKEDMRDKDASRMSKKDRQILVKIRERVDPRSQVPDAERIKIVDLVRSMNNPEKASSTLEKALAEKKSWQFKIYKQIMLSLAIANPGSEVAADMVVASLPLTNKEARENAIQVMSMLRLEEPTLSIITRQIIGFTTPSRRPTPSGRIYHLPLHSRFDSLRALSNIVANDNLYDDMLNALMMSAIHDKSELVQSEVIGLMAQVLNRASNGSKTFVENVDSKRKRALKILNRIEDPEAIKRVFRVLEVLYPYQELEMRKSLAYLVHNGRTEQEKDLAKAIFERHPKPSSSKKNAGSRMTLIEPEDREGLRKALRQISPTLGSQLSNQRLDDLLMLNRLQLYWSEVLAMLHLFKLSPIGVILNSSNSAIRKAYQTSDPLVIVQAIEQAAKIPSLHLTISSFISLIPKAVRLPLAVALGVIVLLQFMVLYGLWTILLKPFVSHHGNKPSISITEIPLLKESLDSNRATRVMATLWNNPDHSHLRSSEATDRLTKHLIEKDPGLLKKEKITVLYPDSGSHVSALDIGHQLIADHGYEGQVEFIFADINPSEWDGRAGIRSSLESLLLTGFYEYGKMEMIHDADSGLGEVRFELSFKGQKIVIRLVPMNPLEGKHWHSTHVKQADIFYHHDGLGILFHNFLRDLWKDQYRDGSKKIWLMAGDFGSEGYTTIDDGEKSGLIYWDMFSEAISIPKGFGTRYSSGEYEFDSAALVEFDDDFLSGLSEEERGAFMDMHVISRIGDLVAGLSFSKDFDPLSNPLIQINNLVFKTKDVLNRLPNESLRRKQLTMLLTRMYWTYYKGPGSLFQVQRFGDWLSQTATFLNYDIRQLTMEEVESMARELSADEDWIKAVLEYRKLYSHRLGPNAVDAGSKTDGSGVLALLSTDNALQDEDEKAEGSRLSDDDFRQLAQTLVDNPNQINLVTAQVLLQGVFHRQVVAQVVMAIFQMSPKEFVTLYTDVELGTAHIEEVRDFVTQLASMVIRIQDFNEINPLGMDADLEINSEEAGYWVEKLTEEIRRIEDGGINNYPFSSKVLGEIRDAMDFFQQSNGMTLGGIGTDEYAKEPNDQLRKDLASFGIPHKIVRAKVLRLKGKEAMRYLGDGLFERSEAIVPFIGDFYFGNGESAHVVEMFPDDFEWVKDEYGNDLEIPVFIEDSNPSRVMTIPSLEIFDRPRVTHNEINQVLSTTEEYEYFLRQVIGGDGAEVFFGELGESISHELSHMNSHTDIYQETFNLRYAAGLRERMEEMGHKNKEPGSSVQYKGLGGEYNYHLASSKNVKNGELDPEEEIIVQYNPAFGLSGLSMVVHPDLVGKKGVFFRAYQPGSNVFLNAEDIRDTTALMRTHQLIANSNRSFLSVLPVDSIELLQSRHLSRLGLNDAEPLYASIRVVVDDTRNLSQILDPSMYQTYLELISNQESVEEAKLEHVERVVRMLGVILANILKNNLTTTWVATRISRNISFGDRLKDLGDLEQIENPLEAMLVIQDIFDVIEDLARASGIPLRDVIQTQSFLRFIQEYMLELPDSSPMIAANFEILFDRFLRRLDDLPDEEYGVMVRNSVVRFLLTYWMGINSLEPTNDQMTRFLAQSELLGMQHKLDPLRRGENIISGARLSKAYSIEELFPKVVVVANRFLQNVDSHHPYKEREEAKLAIKLIHAIQTNVEFKNFLKQAGSASLVLSQLMDIKNSLADKELSHQNREYIVELAKLVLKYIAKWEPKFKKRKNTNPLSLDYAFSVERTVSSVRRASELLEERIGSKNDDYERQLSIYTVVQLAGKHVNSSDEDTQPRIDAIAELELFEGIYMQDLMNEVNRWEDAPLWMYFELSARYLYQHEPGKIDQVISDVTDIHYQIYREQLTTKESQYFLWLDQLLTTSERFYLQTPSPINKSIVTNRLMTNNIVEAATVIRKSISDEGVKEPKSLDCDYCGADISTALYLGNGAPLMRFYDALPFGENENPEDYEDLKNIYLTNKVVTGYSSEIVLWAIGNAKVPLMWELEALGATNIRFESEEEGGGIVHRILFEWSDEAEKTKNNEYILEYRQTKLPVESKELKLVPTRAGDIYLIKAALTAEELPPISSSVILAVGGHFGEIDGYREIEAEELSGFPADPLTMADDKSSYGSLRGASIWIKKEVKKTVSSIPQVGERYRALEGGSSGEDILIIDDVSTETRSVHFADTPANRRVGFRSLRNNYQLVEGSRLTGVLDEQVASMAKKLVPNMSKKSSGPEYDYSAGDRKRAISEIQSFMDKNGIHPLGIKGLFFSAAKDRSSHVRRRAVAAISLFLSRVEEEQRSEDFNRIMSDQIESLLAALKQVPADFMRKQIVEVLIGISSHYPHIIPELRKIGQADSSYVVRNLLNEHFGQFDDKKPSESGARFTQLKKNRIIKSSGNSKAEELSVEDRFYDAKLYQFITKVRRVPMMVFVVIWWVIANSLGVVSFTPLPFVGDGYYGGIIAILYLANFGFGFAAMMLGVYLLGKMVLPKSKLYKSIPFHWLTVLSVPLLLTFISLEYLLGSVAAMVNLYLFGNHGVKAFLFLSGMYSYILLRDQWNKRYGLYHLLIHRLKNNETYVPLEPPNIRLEIGDSYFMLGQNIPNFFKIILDEENYLEVKLKTKDLPGGYAPKHIEHDGSSNMISYVGRAFVDRERGGKKFKGVVVLHLEIDRNGSLIRHFQKGFVSDEINEIVGQWLDSRLYTAWTTKELKELENSPTTNASRLGFVDIYEAIREIRDMEDSDHARRLWIMKLLESGNEKGLLMQLNYLQDQIGSSPFSFEVDTKPLPYKLDRRRVIQSIVVSDEQRLDQAIELWRESLFKTYLEFMFLHGVIDGVGDDGATMSIMINGEEKIDFKITDASQLKNEQLRKYEELKNKGNSVFVYKSSRDNSLLVIAVAIDGRIYDLYEVGDANDSYVAALSLLLYYTNVSWSQEHLNHRSIVIALGEDYESAKGLRDGDRIYGFASGLNETFDERRAYLVVEDARHGSNSFLASWHSMDGTKLGSSFPVSYQALDNLDGFMSTQRVHVISREKLNDASRLGFSDIYEAIREIRDLEDNDYARRLWLMKLFETPEMNEYLSMLNYVNSHISSQPFMFETSEGLLEHDLIRDRVVASIKENPDQRLDQAINQWGVSLSRVYKTMDRLQGGSQRKSPNEQKRMELLMDGGEYVSFNLVGTSQLSGPIMSKYSQYKEEGYSTFVYQVSSNNSFVLFALSVEGRVAYILGVNGDEQAFNAILTMNYRYGGVYWSQDHLDNRSNVISLGDVYDSNQGLNRGDRIYGWKEDLSDDYPENRTYLRVENPQHSNSSFLARWHDIDENPGEVVEIQYQDFERSEESRDYEQIWVISNEFFDAASRMAGIAGGLDQISEISLSVKGYDFTSVILGNHHPFDVNVVVGPDPDKNKAYVVSSPGRYVGPSYEGLSVGFMKRFPDFPTNDVQLVNALSQLSPDNFSSYAFQRLMEGSLNIFEGTQDIDIIMPYLLRAKQAADEVGMISADMALQAIMSGLEGSGAYQPLLKFLNHVVTNPRGNERLGKKDYSVSSIDSVEQIKTLEMWAVKEGADTLVVRVSAQLFSGDKIAFAVNVPKDLSVALRIADDTYGMMTQKFEYFVEDLAEPIAGWVGLAMNYNGGFTKVPYYVTEWVSSESSDVDNYHESHIYSKAGDSIHLWPDQNSGLGPDSRLSENSSDQVWSHIVYFKTAMTDFDRPDRKMSPIISQINAGDYIVQRQYESGAPSMTRVKDIVSVWPEPSGLEIFIEEGVLNEILLMHAMDGEADGVNNSRIVFWKKPQMILEEFVRGYVRNREIHHDSLSATDRQQYREEALSILKVIQNSVLPNWIENPELHNVYRNLGLPQPSSLETQEINLALKRLSEALDDFLDYEGSRLAYGIENDPFVAKMFVAQDIVVQHKKSRYGDSRDDFKETSPLLQSAKLLVEDALKHGEEYPLFVRVIAAETVLQEGRLVGNGAFTTSLFSDYERDLAIRVIQSTFLKNVKKGSDEQKARIWAAGVIANFKLPKSDSALKYLAKVIKNDNQDSLATSIAAKALIQVQYLRVGQGSNIFADHDIDPLVFLKELLVGKLYTQGEPFGFVRTQVATHMLFVFHHARIIFPTHQITKNPNLTSKFIEHLIQVVKRKDTSLLNRVLAAKNLFQHSRLKIIKSIDSEVITQMHQIMNQMSPLGESGYASRLAEVEVNLDTVRQESQKAWNPMMYSAQIFKESLGVELFRKPDPIHEANLRTASVGSLFQLLPYDDVQSVVIEAMGGVDGQVRQRVLEWFKNLLEDPNVLGQLANDETIAQRIQNDFEEDIRRTHPILDRIKSSNARQKMVMELGDEEQILGLLRRISRDDSFQFEQLREFSVHDSTPQKSYQLSWENNQGGQIENATVWIQPIWSAETKAAEERVRINQILNYLDLYPYNQFIHTSQRSGSFIATVSYEENYEFWSYSSEENIEHFERVGELIGKVHRAGFGHSKLSEPSRATGSIVTHSYNSASVIVPKSNRTGFYINGSDFIERSSDHKGLIDQYKHFRSGLLYSRNIRENTPFGDELWMALDRGYARGRGITVAELRRMEGPIPYYPIEERPMSPRPPFPNDPYLSRTNSMSDSGLIDDTQVFREQWMRDGIDHDASSWLSGSVSLLDQGPTADPFTIEVELFIRRLVQLGTDEEDIELFRKYVVPVLKQEGIPVRADGLGEVFYLIERFYIGLKADIGLTTQRQYYIQYFIPEIIKRYASFNLRELELNLSDTRSLLIDLYSSRRYQNASIDPTSEEMSKALTLLAKAAQPSGFPFERNLLIVRDLFERLDRMGSEEVGSYSELIPLAIEATHRYGGYALELDNDLLQVIPSEDEFNQLPDHNPEIPANIEIRDSVEISGKQIPADFVLGLDKLDPVHFHIKRDILPKELPDRSGEVRITYSMTIKGGIVIVTFVLDANAAIKDYFIEDPFNVTKHTLFSDWLDGRKFRSWTKESLANNTGSRLSTRELSFLEVYGLKKDAFQNYHAVQMGNQPIYVENKNLGGERLTKESLRETRKPSGAKLAEPDTSYLNSNGVDVEKYAQQYKAKLERMSEELTQLRVVVSPEVLNKVSSTNFVDFKASYESFFSQVNRLSVVIESAESLSSKDALRSVYGEKVILIADASEQDSLRSLGINKVDNLSIFAMDQGNDQVGMVLLESVDYHVRFKSVDMVDQEPNDLEREMFDGDRSWIIRKERHTSSGQFTGEANIFRKPAQPVEWGFDIETHILSLRQTKIMA